MLRTSAKHGEPRVARKLCNGQTLTTLVHLFLDVRTEPNKIVVSSANLTVLVSEVRQSSLGEERHVSECSSI